jgi:surfeit locus 1 family protein
LFTLLKRFRPSLTGTLLVIACVLLFIHLGNWQYQKAVSKKSQQQQYDLAQQAPYQPLDFPLKGLVELQYKRLELKGNYLKKYQLLLDNQVEGEVAGYHVISPFKISSINQVVLIDRGWIPARSRHTDLPQVDIPDGEQILQGQIWLPPKKVFKLSSNLEPLKEQSSVWQYLDLDAYRQQAPFKVLPIVIRLAPENKGGYVRNWVRPDDRIDMHLSYAYQWYGFALSAIFIYLFVSFRRLKSS